MFNSFALLGLSTPLALIIIIVLLAILVFEITMFISVIRNQHITSNTKILWIVAMLLIHPIVAIAYYFTDYKKS